jgi:DNA-binding Lrp family transcriptional regulator|tara:strand:+ start:1199 stop:1444 length:246 start_codon:yes stop_codon:yes gene_type:complete
MSESFVLINVAMGKEAEVLEELRSVPGISMVYGTYGAYDVVTKVEADDQTNMRDIITKKIRKIEHVRSTLALIIIDEQNDE